MQIMQMIKLEFMIKDSLRLIVTYHLSKQPQPILFGLLLISTDNTGGSTTDSPALKATQYITNANDAANFNMCGVIDTTGHTTYTDVYARLKHNNGSSQNMLLWYGQLMVYRIG